MVRLNKIVIPAIILSLWPFAVKGQVVLSEIMFHAPESEAYEEFIELYNISSDIWIDLTGYRLGDQLEQDELIKARLIINKIYLI